MTEQAVDAYSESERITA
jgi:hypothetical protein